MKTVKRRKIPRTSAYTISDKAIRFRHPDYNPDRAQKLISSSISRHLSSRHPNPCTRFWVGLILLTNRQTNKQTNEHRQKHVPPPLSEVINSSVAQQQHPFTVRVCDNSEVILRIIVISLLHGWLDTTSRNSSLHNYLAYVDGWWTLIVYVRQSWKACQRLCNPQGARGLNRRMFEFQPDAVHPELVARSKEMLLDIDIAKVQAVGPAAITFYVWVCT